MHPGRGRKLVSKAVVSNVATVFIDGSQGTITGGLCHEDATTNGKTDSNPKAPCLDCMVDVISNPTPAYTASSRSSH
ncbi:hypothetical protein TNCV_112471 [Trichonephila clavipes]|nr:hypothetical protein TNCV_112471 [Trichonephila clavipes]